jgi:hypothetical protein
MMNIFSVDEDPETIKDRIQEVVSERSLFLGHLFDKYRDMISFEYLGNPCLLGKRSPGKIRMNLDAVEYPSDTIAITVGCFHEIAHEMDEKSKYHFLTELRAHGFEYKVAKRLGYPFSLFVGPMSEAAYNRDTETFGEYFNKHPAYRHRAGTMRYKPRS